MRRSTFSTAFTLTAAALLFVVAGALGYNLDRHSRFVEGTAWRESIIWWEIWVGAALVPLAAYYWRRALRSI